MHPKNIRYIIFFSLLISVPVAAKFDVWGAFAPAVLFLVVAVAAAFSDNTWGIIVAIPFLAIFLVYAGLLFWAANTITKRILRLPEAAQIKRTLIIAGILVAISFLPIYLTGSASDSEFHPTNIIGIFSGGLETDHR